MHYLAALFAILLGAGQGAAGATGAQTSAITQAFAQHCFSPFLTAQKAEALIASTGARVDFYDLTPFSSASPSPVQGRAATQGTDRRCEVAFDGAHSQSAAKVAIAALQSEGITQDAPLPQGFYADSTTTLLAARRLNPQRIAVVHVGTRDGQNGLETFMRVERLVPQLREDIE